MNELYQLLAPAVRDELSRHEEQATVPAGRNLISESVIPEYLIAIQKGSVEISVPSGKKAMPVSVAREGKVLGLRPIVADTLPGFNATCLEQCKISMIPRRDFLDVLNQHPEMYFAVAKVLSIDLNTAERFLRKASRAANREKRATDRATST